MLTDQSFKPVGKDRLFYDRFQYCLGFSLEEAACLRTLDHAMIDETFARRKHWRDISRQRWHSTPWRKTMINKFDVPVLGEHVLKDLHTVANVLLKTTADFKLVISSNQVYVYSNNLEFLTELDHQPELIFKTYTQVQINRPKNTVRLKKSSHRFRSYFRTTNLSSHEKQVLSNFLKTQTDFVRISPALLSWLEQPFTRTQEYYFVDYDSETWLTMIGLVRPGLIRKTLQILTDK